MARIAKYHKGSEGRLFLHVNRKQGDGVKHSNEMIDDRRTNLNYYFKEGGAKELRERLSHLYARKNKNLVTLCEAIVTLPKDVENEDEEKFFEAVHEFYCKDFGEENIITSCVHKDETRPHIHILFCPVKAREDTLQIQNYEKAHGVTVEGMVCSREVLNREYLKNMHPRLSDFIEERLGYQCEILNGATANGNKTILQMKVERLEQQIAVQTEALARADKNFRTIQEQIIASGVNREYFRFGEMFNENQMLRAKYETLRDALLDSGIELPQETVTDLFNLTPRFGVYMNAEKADAVTGIRVIETYKNVPRCLPDNDYIVSHNLSDVAENQSEVNYDEANNVIWFPTDDLEDTVRGLTALRQLGIKKKIIMPKISNDYFDVTACILAQTNLDILYRMNDSARNRMLERYRQMM